MRWKFWEKESSVNSSNEVTPLAAADAEVAIASILRPSAATGRPLRAPTTTSTASEKSERLALKSTVVGGLKPLSTSQGSSSSPLPTVAVESTATKPAAAVVAIDWRQLPPSPIAGYELTEKGLFDHSADPPSTVSVSQLRRLIDGTASFEAKAKYELDSTTNAHLSLHTRRRVEPLISIACLVTGSYLLFMRAPKLFAQSVARDSLLLRGVLRVARWTPKERWFEETAQRYRWLLQASTEASALAVVGGLALLRVGWQTLDWSEDPHIGTSDGQLGQNTVAYQHHTEAVLKWLYAVYFHHPAYRDEASRGEAARFR